MNDLNPCGWRHLILQRIDTRPLPTLDECEDGIALCDYFDDAVAAHAHDDETLGKAA